MASTKKSQFQVLLAPRITEKAALERSLTNGVVFEVHPSANKTEIKDAIERIFKVKVKSVRTANSRGKLKARATGTRTRGTWKKAYVRLMPGNTIDIIEGL